MIKDDLRGPIENLSPVMFVEWVEMGLIGFCQRGHTFYADELHLSQRCPVCKIGAVYLVGRDTKTEANEAITELRQRIKDMTYAPFDARKMHPPRDPALPRPPTKIGNAVLKIREHLQCSQKELSWILKVSQSKIAVLESGSQKSVRSNTAIKFRQLCEICNLMDLAPLFEIKGVRRSQSRIQELRMGVFGGRYRGWEK